MDNIESRFVVGLSNIFGGVYVCTFQLGYFTGCGREGEYGSRFVVGTSNILFGGVYVCTFQPGDVKAVAVKGCH